MEETLPVVDDNLKDIFVQAEQDFPIQYYVDELEKYPSQRIVLHWHTELEFYVVRGCELKIQLGQETLVLNEGEGIFINSNVLHSYAPNRKGISTHPNIVFASGLIASYGSLVHNRYVSKIVNNEEIPYILLNKKDNWQSEILSLLDKIFSLLQKYGKASDHYGQFPILPFDNANITSFCYELDVQILIGQVWKIIYEHRNSIPRIKTPKGNQTLQIRVQKMVAFIHEQYSNSVSLGDIASAADISKSEAARCFEAYLKTSPGRYLHKYRLMEAQRQLLLTDCTVSEIAQNCGFETSSYFCKMFKADTEMTPLQYRQNNRIKKD